MSECFMQVEDDLKVKCDDCQWEGLSQQLEMVNDIQERLTPGGVVPAGQCPECGALAYLVEDEPAQRSEDDAAIVPDRENEPSVDFLMEGDSAWLRVGTVVLYIRKVDDAKGRPAVNVEAHRHGSDYLVPIETMEVIQ